MSVHLDRTVTQNFAEAIGREWLETNGIGGWASSTINNAHTRRYHGLLVAATRPPVGRVVLLSKLDETLVREDARIELGTNVYPGSVHPQGYRYLTAFSQDFFPSFTYEVDGIVLQKIVAAIHGENTTVILYRVIEAPAMFKLELRPFVAGRDYHSLMQANDSIRQESHFSGDIWSYQPYEQLPTFYMLLPRTAFEANPDWYHSFEYLAEKQRGQDFQEDLFTPGVFTTSLKTGDQLGIIVSTENPIGRDAENLITAEKARRKNLFSALPVKDELTRALTLAADQFVVRRGDDLKTIIAGYPWFTDWGRDTMIALPGLTLVTGRYADAKKIIKRFVQVFWNPEGGYLFDLVDGERHDGVIRPNQILALSLPFALLGRNRARQVLKIVEDHLLTPVGLRSLSPQDPAYNPTYQGNAYQRDSAYHQGTVWAWLLGPYLTALVRVRGKTGRKQGLKLVQAVQNHLSESGIGQISEIFDGDAPHAPRGCIAQAWSVAEIARAYVEDLLDAGP